MDKPKKKRCRHSDNSWIILGGRAEWCYVYGAYRVLKSVPDPNSTGNTLEADGPWRRPSGNPDVNPWDSEAQEKWLKRKRKEE